MLERLRAFIERTGLIPDGSRVLVGYSGGPDSTCLLHLLHAMGVDVVAAHLHHGQRPEADLEAKLCTAFCDDLGIPIVNGNADVPRMAADLGIGLEEAGRRARYSFFEQAAFQTNCQLIATAHTKTDHVETVLLNLIRGSGMSGVSGIPLKRANVIRPLIEFDRDETRRYCEELGLWTHNDPANVDVDFSRARLRLRVLPELASINPQVHEAIARFSAIVREEDRFLDGAAASALERAEIPLNGELAFLTKDCEIALSRQAMEALPPVLFRRSLRLATNVLGAPLNFEQVKTIEESLSNGQTGSITAEGGQVVVEWTDDRIHLRQLMPDVPYRYPLTLPGETESDEFGWKFVAFPSPGASKDQSRKGMSAVIDPKSVKGSLYFRPAESGDDIHPLGFEGKRKVSDLLSEAKLTLAARKRLPIICDMVGPIWIPGICLSNRVKLAGSIENAIHVRFGPLEPGPKYEPATTPGK